MPVAYDKTLFSKQLKDWESFLKIDNLTKNHQPNLVFMSRNQKR